MKRPFFWGILFLLLVPVSAHAVTWTLLANVPAGVVTNFGRMVRATDGTFYVSGTASANTPGPGVFRTTDYGATLTAINTGLPSGKDTGALCLNALDEPLIEMSGRVNGIFNTYRYTGGTWVASTGISYNYGIRQFMKDPGGNLFAPTAWGCDIYRSTDNGATWSLRAGNLSNFGGAAWVIARASNGDLYVGGEFPRLYKSTNDGVDWTVFPIDLGGGNAGTGDLNQCLVTAAGSILIGGHGDAPTGRFAWRYASGTWAYMTGIPAYSKPVHFYQLSSGTLIANTLTSVYTSVNDGVSWQAAITGLTGSYSFDGGSLVVDPSDNIYLAVLDPVTLALKSVWWSGGGAPPAPGGWGPRGNASGRTNASGRVDASGRVSATGRS